MMKLCTKCNKILPSLEFYKKSERKSGISSFCKICTKLDNNQRYHSKYKESSIFKYRVKNYAHKWHIANKEKNNRRISDDEKKRRMQCIEHYGGRCECCGEVRYEFLAIDHINGGGEKHRKKIGNKIARWLLRNNFPSGFRILCHNCNQALGHYGYCPHENGLVRNHPVWVKQKLGDEGRGVLTI